LIDIEHLSNWENLSLIRSLYWKTTDYITSGIFLNKKLLVCKANFLKKDYKEEYFNINQKFSVENYTPREKMLLKANKNYLDYSINLNFRERYELWKSKLQVFLNNIPNTTKVYIIFIPHCSQLSDFYYNNTKALGANYTDKAKVLNSTYTFFKTAKNDFIKKKNIIFLNPLDYFKSKDSEENRVYYEIDPHLTAYGQSILSEYIEKSIF